MLLLKLFLRFNILVLSLNIIEASDHVNDLIYCSLFGSFLYLFKLVNLDKLILFLVQYWLLSCTNFFCNNFFHLFFDKLAIWYSDSLRSFFLLSECNKWLAKLPVFDLYSFSWMSSMSFIYFSELRKTHRYVDIFQILRWLAILLFLRIYLLVVLMLVF